MSEKCSKCNTSVEGDKVAIKCCECENSFHATCCRIRSVDALRKLGNRRATWRCDTCKLETLSSHSRSDTESETIMAMLQVMREDIKAGMRESKDRFAGLESSILSVKNSLDEFKANVVKLEEETKATAQSCEENKTEIKNTQSELTKLRVEVLELQQYSRRNNIEVKGVPMTEGEEVFAVLAQLARSLNVPCNREDFSVVHRLKRTATGHPNIIAAFVSRTTREVWLAAAKKRRLVAADVSPRFGQEPVYINSHLTGYNKQLLGRAKGLVRAGKLAAAWTAQDKVLVRRAEGDRAYRIWLLEELDNFCGNN